MQAEAPRLYGSSFASLCLVVPTGVDQHVRQAQDRIRGRVRPRSRLARLDRAAVEDLGLLVLTELQVGQRQIVAVRRRIRVSRTEDLLLEGEGLGVRFFSSQYVVIGRPLTSSITKYGRPISVVPTSST